MQYLAEVQKKGGGLLASSKVELRLIACQRTEDNWQALAGNQMVPTDRANEFGSGSLVIADVAGNEVKRVTAATQPVLKILQHYSRLQDKLKDKDDDIEQWKQSLTYQSQELNRRVMEVEMREEELTQASEELARLEQQRNEVAALREEAQRSKAEIEARSQELEAAWAKLEGEKQAGGGGQSGGLLDEAQVRGLESQLNQLADASHAVGDLQPQIAALLERLEQTGPASPASSGDGSRPVQAWSEALAELEQLKGELIGLQHELSAKKQAADSLQRQLKANDLLKQQLTHLAGGLDPELAAQINLDELESMSLGDLETKVQERQKDYDRIFNFVNDQEEELRLQQQAMEDLKVKISEASEFDRLSLEAELSDEQDSYRILDESMFDQRRTLSERRALLNEYQAVLARRQGQKLDEVRPSIDVGPVLAQLEADRKLQSQQLEELRAEMQAAEGKVAALEGQIAQQAESQQVLKQQALASSTGGGGDPDALQAMMGDLRGQIQALQADCDRLQQSRDQQMRIIESTRQMLAEMSGNVQFSAAA